MPVFNYNSLIIGGHYIEHSGGLIYCDGRYLESLTIIGHKILCAFYACREGCIILICQELLLKF